MPVDEKGEVSEMMNKQVVLHVQTLILTYPRSFVYLNRAFSTSTPCQGGFISSNDNVLVG